LSEEQDAGANPFERSPIASSPGPRARSHDAAKEDSGHDEPFHQYCERRQASPSSTIAGDGGTTGSHRDVAEARGAASGYLDALHEEV